MKKVCLSFIVTALLFCGCTSEFDEFNSTILNYEKNDNKIDKKEHENLVSFINAAKDKKFKIFIGENGKINNDTLDDYILKLATAKRLSLNITDIWKEDNTRKFNINVFTDNTGSMNGYLKDPDTQFKNSIYLLLNNLKLFPHTDSLNLFLINNQNLPIYKNASRQDIERFKDSLNPDYFKLSRGKVSGSDLNEWIDKTLQKVNQNNLSVFISDCIYSPDKINSDAKTYLDFQKIGIKTKFEYKLKTEDVGVVILQFFGKFNDMYYDHLNTPLDIKNISRPYYMWFIGTDEQINELLKSGKLEDKDFHYTNKIVMHPIKKSFQSKFYITPSATYGNFDRGLLANKIISNATSSTAVKSKDLFGFKIAVDFSKILQDNTFFLDANNYELTGGKYNLNIKPIMNKSDPITKNATHILTLQTSELVSTNLQINVIPKIPEWIIKSSSMNDSAMKSDSLESKKTFGFQYLVEGVFNAFYESTKPNIISQINIKIIKK